MSLLLAPLLAQALSVNVGASMEQRVRSTDAEIGHDNVVVAQSALRLSTERTSWALTYSPRVTHTALGEPDMARTVMHDGGLTGQLQLSRRTMAFFSESGSYGTQDFNALAIDAASFVDPEGTTTPNSSNQVATQPDTSQIQTGPQAIRQNYEIRYGAVTTTAALSHQLDRRINGSVAASYSVTGGMDRQSRLLYPRYKQVLGMGQLTYAVSRSDRMSLRAEGTRINTSLKLSVDISTLEAEWVHEFSAAASSTVSLGQSSWLWRSGEGEERLGFMPSGAASISYQNPRRYGGWLLNVSERVEPLMDRLLGTVNPSSTTSAFFTMSFDKLAVRVNSTASYTASEMQRSSGVTFGAAESLAYTVSKSVVTELGTRQSVLGAADASPTMVLWTGYVVVSISSGDLRF